MVKRTNTLLTAMSSSVRWVVLAWRRGIYLRKDRGDRALTLHAQRYVVFRETAMRFPVDGTPVVLVIGFRLLAVRSNKILHWLFQRLCILSTPAWSGLPGFQTKLWMVNPKTKDYVGLYAWRGEAQSQAYITFLLPVLRIFSVGGSVWYERAVGQGLDRFLAAQTAMNKKTSSHQIHETAVH